LVKVWGSHDMLSTMLLAFLRKEAMPHSMLTIVCNYTIQQTAPGIALDVAFVLAGDGRTLAQHIDDIDAGLPWDFISPQSPNPLSPAKSLRKRPLGEKKICQNIPKYP
jgi:hypothetical protein